MNRFKVVGLFFSLALLILAIPATVSADERNQTTRVTFTQPVEVPGSGSQVLPAGTYVFRLLNSLSDRHVVQIFNADQTHVFTTILAIPNYRPRSTNETVMTFRERAAGEPQAIRTWFYPGRQFGHEFVYPKFRAIQLAKIVNEPVLATTIELTPETPVETIAAAPIVAIRPTGEEVPVTEVVQAAPPAQRPVDTRAADDELPQTASPLPLLGLMGLLSLGTGWVLRRIAKRTV